MPMTWNYRLMKISHTLPDGSSEDEFGIHEVYYGEDGSVRSYTEDPVMPLGVDLEEFRCDFENYSKAVNDGGSEVLTPEDFPGPK
jgi:hypothetical protein